MAEAEVPTRVDLWLDGYAAGVADGRASRDDEVEAVERIADYWYARALDPSIATEERRQIQTLIDGREENARRAARYAELDALDQELYAQARAMIAEGHDDLAVATALGLFLPLVANIRAGVV